MPARSILSVRLPDVATADVGWRHVAKELGSEAILIEARHTLFDDGVVDRLSAIGQPAIVPVDLTRFPIDHPLVHDHPRAFAIRRAVTDPIVDPRRAMPVAGEALARLKDEAAVAALVPAIVSRLASWSQAGAIGVVLLNHARIADGVFAAIRASLPDLRQFHEEAASVSLSALLGDALAERKSNGDLQSWYRIAEPSASAPEAARLAAILGGAIVPFDALRTRGADSVRAAIADSPTLIGEPRAVATKDDVMIMIASDAADLRRATRYQAIAINRSPETRSIDDVARALMRAGALVERPDNLASLEPYETRVLTLTRSKPILEGRTMDATKAREWPRLVVEDVTPTVAGGDFAVKRVVGDTVTVEATVFADGHEQLAAELLWRARDADDWQRVPMTATGNDRWTADFTLDRLGAHEFVVEGWLDRFGGFARDFGKKRDAAVAMPVDFAEGELLVREAIERAGDGDRALLEDAHAAYRKAGGDFDAQADLLLAPGLRALIMSADDRPHALRSTPQRVDAERLAARFSSWYELFPRSQTNDKARHGTFADVIERLPAVRDMGFDTLYFPPIHPIGKINRKGPNNTLTPGPDDPGSPYAIGAAEGGHDAIHPELGTFEDFDRLVAAAADHGLEIALDFAIQAAPDHPWLKEHPGWFAWRPDGSMKYAENPPKKYQDIVNVDFYGPDAVPGLWTALRDVILLWVDHGVKTFRVDNPHTKPLPFWEWMIGDVRAKHPDVIFLSEAFTRPTMMYRLAKVGFSQSYTYFTWREHKQELIDYITELTTTEPKEFYRPHFFVNTPDINPFFLQTSGRPGFRIRAVLAATLSGLFGVYSGFELCDGTPLAPGKEEYLDSEKFEIRPRDWQAPGNIIADITLLNRLRQENPALQTHLNTRFYVAHNDQIMWYGKPAADGSDIIMVMVSLDPHHAQSCDFEVPLWDFGLGDDASIGVEDLAHGHRFDWHGKMQSITLDPEEPYRIWRLTPQEAQA